MKRLFTFAQTQNMIWFREYRLTDLQDKNNDTIHQSLGIKFYEPGEDYLEAEMPVDERTKQPAGFLHGGASVVLAESLGSVGSFLILDPEKYYCFGQSINASHIRPVREGKVIGKAIPVHLGKTSHIWSIEIKNEEGKLVCISRLTVAVLRKP